MYVLYPYADSPGMQKRPSGHGGRDKKKRATARVGEKSRRERKKKIKEQDVEEINTKIKVGLWKEQAICLLRSLKT